MSNCQHEVFRADVNVGRIADPGQPIRFVADIEIRCEQCNERFRFLGVPAGLSFEEPRVDIMGTTLHAPIEPEMVPMLHTRMRFDMPPVIP